MAAEKQSKIHKGEKLTSVKTALTRITILPEGCDICRNVTEQNAKK